MSRDHTRPYFMTLVQKEVVWMGTEPQGRKSPNETSWDERGDGGANRKLSNSNTNPEKPKTLVLPGASEFGAEAKRIP